MDAILAACVCRRVRVASSLRRWLRSFAYNNARVYGSSPATAHIGRSHSLQMVDLFRHGPQQPYLQCLGRLSPLATRVVVVIECCPLRAAREKRQWRGDKRHRHNAGLHKGGGQCRRGVAASFYTCVSPTTFRGYRTTFTFLLAKWTAPNPK